MKLGGNIKATTKELYMKQMEVYLKILNINKQDHIVNQPECLSEEFQKDLKKHFLRITSGNVDEEVLDQAIAEIVPYLSIDEEV